MLPHSYQLLAAIVLVIGGLVACSAGYRLFRVVLTVYGFILGALVASSAMGASDTVGLVVAAAIGGVLGALVLFLAYFVGVALIGAGLGALVVHVIWTQVGGDPHPLVVILFSVAGAIGAMALQRYVIIAGTALAGAWTLVVGGLALAGDRGALTAATAGDVWILYPFDPAPGRRWVLPAWIALSLFGLVVQLGLTGKARKKKKS